MTVPVFPMVYKQAGHVCFTFVLFIHSIMTRERAIKPTGKITAIKTGLPKMPMSITAAINAKKRIGKLESTRKRKSTR